VWVIAETPDLRTGFRKIVVTDERGRYLVPDLPRANYRLWVRGYGLVDSMKVGAVPGKLVNLTAAVAPDARAAAQIYPAVYWFSLLNVPAASEFPGGKNDIAPGMRSQVDWINQMKTGCMQCHQLGTRATREIPKMFASATSSVDAWDRRVQASQYGSSMTSAMSGFGRRRGLAMFADWTDRIAAGEVPPAPPRPEGVERHLVITQWDWADPLTFTHDVTTTDRRNPTLNPFGLIYANDRNNEPNVLTLDPVRHIATKSLSVPVRDADTPHFPPQAIIAPSAYWGEEIIWRGKSNMHNQMFDERGRVWMTSTIRASGNNPTFCQAGSDHPSAKAFPLSASGRQASVYDPRTGGMTLIDLCFATHHLVFAEDANDTLWFSGSGEVIGWLDTRLFEQTGDAAKAQGWSPFVIDTNGYGKRDAYVEPDQPVDPSKDKRVGGRGGAGGTGFGQGFYGVAVNPVDGTVWGSVVDVPGRIIRFDPKTGLSEMYELPLGNPNAPVQGFTPRGIDVDRNGLVWTGLQSGHLASFDRRKCRTLNGPEAVGDSADSTVTYNAEAAERAEKNLVIRCCSTPTSLRPRRSLRFFVTGDSLESPVSFCLCL
jgi:hypothetical protein